MLQRISNGGITRGRTGLGVALLMLMVVGGSLDASPRPLAVQRRAERVEGRKARVAATAPVAPAEVSGLQGQQWTGGATVQPPTRSAQAETRSRWQPNVGGNRPDVMQAVRRDGPEARQPRREPASEGSGVPRTPANERSRLPAGTARLVQGAPVVTLDLDRDRRGEMLESAPSMQDINRFQFREGRSDEPGLPVAPAGRETGNRSKRRGGR